MVELPLLLPNVKFFLRETEREWIKETFVRLKEMKKLFLDEVVELDHQEEITQLLVGKRNMRMVKEQ